MTDYDWGPGGLSERSTNRAAEGLTKKVNKERIKSASERTERTRDHLYGPSSTQTGSYNADRQSYRVGTKAGEVYTRSVTNGSLPVNAPSDAGMGPRPLSTWKPSVQPEKKIYADNDGGDFGTALWILYSIEKENYYEFWVGGVAEPFKLKEVPKTLKPCLGPDGNPIPPNGGFPPDTGCYAAYAASGPLPPYIPNGGYNCAVGLGDNIDAIIGPCVRSRMGAVPTSTFVPVPREEDGWQIRGETQFDQIVRRAYLLAADGSLIIDDLGCDLKSNKKPVWIMYNMVYRLWKDDIPFSREVPGVGLSNAYSLFSIVNLEPFAPDQPAPTPPTYNEVFGMLEGDQPLIRNSCAEECAPPPPDNPPPGFYDRENRYQAHISAAAPGLAFVTIKEGVDCEDEDRYEKRTYFILLLNDEGQIVLGQEFGGDGLANGADADWWAWSVAYASDQEVIDNAPGACYASFAFSERANNIRNNQDGSYTIGAMWWLVDADSKPQAAGGTATATGYRYAQDPSPFGLCVLFNDPEDEERAPETSSADYLPFDPDGVVEGVAFVP